jgi:hypothetical protein
MRIQNSNCLPIESRKKVKKLNRILSKQKIKNKNKNSNLELTA